MFASDAITPPRAATGTLRPAPMSARPAIYRLAEAAPMAPASLLAIAARAVETKAEDPARLLWLATLMSFHAIDLAFDGHAHRSQDTQSLADAIRREVAGQ